MIGYRTPALARVVDRTGSLDADRKGQAPEPRVLRQRPNTVDRVWWNPDQIPLSDLSLLVSNLHDAAPGNDVIEL